MTFIIAEAPLNAGVDAHVALADGGSLEVRTGSSPATAAAADSGTLLVDIALPEADAFSAASYAAGISTATLDVGSIATAIAAATGTAGHYRFKDSGGTVIWQGDIADGHLVLSSNDIESGQEVDVISYTYRHISPEAVV